MTSSGQVAGRSGAPRGRNSASGSWSRRLVPFLLLGGVVLAAVRVAGSAKIEPADFVWNNATEIQTLDPATVTGVPEGRALRAIFEGLTVKDPVTLAPLPGSAESWEISEDGRVYTFHIRREARWTNGDPLSAHDFVYSWQRVLHPATGANYAYQLWYIRGARDYTTQVDPDGEPLNDFASVGLRALDDHTLEVTLATPTPFFIDLAGFYPLFPVNRRNIEEAQDKWPDSWEIEWLKPENIVTNGPYRVAYRRVNDRIRLVKNDVYWDADKVAFERIDLLAIEQGITGLNVYLTGGSHWQTNVPVNLVPDLLPRIDFNPTPYLGSYFYRVNTTRPPLDDARVRRALALCIDRTTIAEKITKSGQVPAFGLVPPGLNGYRGAVMEVGEDPELARQLLAEAGYGPGGKPIPTIEILYNTLESHRDIAESIADSWKRELGISAKLLNQEWKVYLDTQSNLGYDVARASWIGDYADPNTFLDLFVTGGENNKTGWGDPEYDRLIAAAAAELDAPRRMDLLRQAEALLMRELPVLPIYYYVTQNIYSPRIGGFAENIQDEHFPKFFYWMDDDELAAKLGLPSNHADVVGASGPREGLYSPAQLRARAGR